MTAAQDFIAAHLDQARTASAAIGVPVAAILAQWINETNSGQADNFTQGHNFAGVSLPDANGNWYVVQYSDENAGLNGYIQRWGASSMTDARTKIAAAGGANANPYVAAQAIEASPWASGHYGYNGLEALIQDLNLSQYDKGGRVPNPSHIGISGGPLGLQLGAAAAAQQAGSGGFYGCPEGKLFDGPSVLGQRFYLTKCQGRALLGGASLAAGLGLMLIGLGLVAIGGRNPVAQLARAAT